MYTLHIMYTVKMRTYKFNAERRKKRQSSKKGDKKLHLNDFIAIQITNKDVSDVEIFVTIYI